MVIGPYILVILFLWERFLIFISQVTSSIASLKYVRIFNVTITNYCLKKGSNDLCSPQTECSLSLKILLLCWAPSFPSLPVKLKQDLASICMSYSICQVLFTAFIPVIGNRLNFIYCLLRIV